MNERFKFRAWISKEKALMCYGERYIYFNAVQGLNTGREGFDCIEQCTGLKDKNGKLIYEGDIVVDEFGDKMLMCWNDIDLQFCLKQSDDWYVHTNAEIEVIGNIHENSELLEKSYE